MRNFSKHRQDSAEEVYNKQDKRLWFGLFLIIVGAGWLLDNLNILPYYIPNYLLSWKTFLIALGVFLLFRAKQKGSGILLILIGGIFLVDDLNLFDLHNLRHLLWPAAIILAGIVIVARRKTTLIKEADSSGIDYIDDVSIFGGGEKFNDSQNFKGGRLTAIFGGSDIDLSHAQLAEGRHVLDMFCMFGGSSVTVPEDWDVQVDMTAILGGFSDSRKSSAKRVADPEKVLIIKGFVLLGGGEVKHAK